MAKSKIREAEDLIVEAFAPEIKSAELMAENVPDTEHKVIYNNQIEYLKQARRSCKKVVKKILTEKLNQDG